MSKRVTIVMYHFVRDLQRSPYPDIKGLDLAEFNEQIGYIAKHYTPVTMEDVIDAARSGDSRLPGNAILLTFDDGYIDHYRNVFPVLVEHRMQGSFFPPAKPVVEHRVLDVNKIHFILAAAKDKARLVQRILAEIECHAESHGLDKADRYYERLAVPNRYDSADVVFIKKVLQMALPADLRAEVAARLFEEFVTCEEGEFARELYMSVEQLREMRGRGMHIGSHGYEHYWMNTLAPRQRLEEIERSLGFLGTLGCNRDGWAMCYPYGAYDEALLGMVKAMGCAIGLATSVALADLSTDNILALPRIDTNDLPKDCRMPPNEWTRRAVGDGLQRQQ